MDMFKCALHQVLRNYILYPNPPANLPCGGETGVPGENPRLSAERWTYSFHMRNSKSPDGESNPRLRGERRSC